MPGDWPFALALLLALGGAFAIAVLAGLRIRRRQMRLNLESINADAVWSELVNQPEFDGSRWTREDLLYGVWQDFSAEAVGMVVKNGHDQAVGQVAHGMTQATIEAGEKRCRVVVGTTWRESAKLEFANEDGADICSFERKGLTGDRVARYSAPGVGPLEIPVTWGSPFAPFASPITSDGQPVGRIWRIQGPNQDKGRALILPAKWPLPIRLFVLAWGTGPRRPRR
jgi:hypothetical protein